jgi:hypothetical protein
MVSLLAIVPYSVYCGRVLTMASATALIASATARVAWICALANSAGPASGDLRTWATFTDDCLCHTKAIVLHYPVLCRWIDVTVECREQHCQHAVYHATSVTRKSSNREPHVRFTSWRICRMSHGSISRNYSVACRLMHRVGCSVALTADGVESLGPYGLEVRAVAADACQHRADHCESIAMRTFPGR